MFANIFNKILIQKEEGANFKNKFDLIFGNSQKKKKKIPVSLRRVVEKQILNKLVLVKE